jgi:transglutaminase-like putative cysteine protease
MLSRKVGIAIASVAIVIILLASAFVLLNPAPEKTAASYYSDGMAELEKGNYGKASDLFGHSYEGYHAKNDTANATAALHQKFIAERVLAEYPFSRDQVVEQVKFRYPGLSNQTIEKMLDEMQAEHIDTDGETRYFADVPSNVGFRNLTLLRQSFQAMGGTPTFDALLPLVLASGGEHDTFFNRTDFRVTGNLTIPRDMLPSSGILKLWLPAPINTDSQGSVSMNVVSPGRTVSSSAPDSQLGLTYVEVDLASQNADVKVWMNYTYSEYQQKFDIDPGNVGEYNHSSPLYLQFTASHGNILVTPEIQALAESIIGAEKNPYLQARLVYQHILGNITYSFTPHASLCALGVPESEYVRTHQFGDCGAQSMYFAALMRALGVPARATGGYQAFPPASGTHIWAEFYLPNYGWVPVDVTAAETADWSYNATAEQRAAFKDFFLGNLDPYRFVIQVDCDLAAEPSIGDSVQLTTVYQMPAIVCEGSAVDLAKDTAPYWHIEVRPA